MVDTRKEINMVMRLKKAIGRSPVRRLSEKVMFLLKVGEREAANLANCYGKSILGRGNIKCKGPDVGTRLICLRN